MGRWERQWWEPADSAPNRRDRSGGQYQTYLPDPLLTRPIMVSPALQQQAWHAEEAVRVLAQHRESTALEGLARLLLRSEAIASSRIEGLQVSPQNVALAEFAHDEDLGETSLGRNAQLVANNVIALRTATADPRATITTDTVDALHRALLPDHTPPGMRGVQNWLGGSNWSPLEAEYVPPPAEAVTPLMADLVEYSSGALHAALVQAGVVHAQFETIHPYTDGNGRVGRALIHTVLARRGLVRAATVPVSMVLLTRSDDYVRALTAYRYGPDDDPTAAVEQWLRLFLEAVQTATTIAEGFATQLAELREQWQSALITSRTARGLRAQLRQDSAAARLVASLAQTPVLTARSVQHSLGVSNPAARGALDELATAGILTPRRVARGTTGFLATDVFAVLTSTERRLASTRFDTRVVKPNRATPAVPIHQNAPSREA